MLSESQYSLLRKLLFKLDPETAHRLTLLALQQFSYLGPLNPARQTIPDQPVNAMGLTFPNPVGLAAGLDKDATCMDGLGALGFGFLETGTLTPRPQSGNPKPRLFRLVKSQALINRMGFNNQGIDNAISRIKRTQYTGILGINIGKNRSTPIESAIDDYLTGLQKAYLSADYITVNISSPNTPGLRELQGADHLSALLAALSGQRYELEQQNRKKVPILVKIAPDCNPQQLRQIADITVENGMDGIIATNTTASRTGVENQINADQQGGLSGAPLFEKSLQTLEHLRSMLGSEMTLIGCGGITSPQRAKQMIAAGANLIQLYSGLIYQGPALIAAIAEELKS